MVEPKPMALSAPPADVDEYLARLPEGARATLEKIRKTIRSVVPKATEVISYQMPMFKLNGRGLVAFAAFKNHCSLFPMSKAVIKAHQDELKKYETSTGTRFPLDKPLPATLLKKIIKQRLAEHAAKSFRRQKAQDGQ